jgi:hypothetical protein
MYLCTIKKVSCAHHAITSIFGTEGKIYTNNIDCIKGTRTLFKTQLYLATSIRGNSFRE